MAGNVNIIVVNVGQGQCTFVEIYTTSAQTTLSHALLFDCGSDKYNENGVDQVDVNLNYIAARVSTLPEPGFDCIFFSHSDKDHTSLTERLLLKIDNLAGKKAKVKEVWYAGAKDDYTKGSSGGKKFNILNHMVTNGYCLLADEKTTESNYTGYDKTTDQFIEYLWRSGSTADDVVVYPIVSNSLSADPDNEEEIEAGKKAEVRNRVSMICGLQYAGGFYTICGDATNITMEIVNLTYKHPSTVFSNNNMTTLPHHGSRSTGLAVARNAKPSDKAVATVKSFSTLLQSKSITISAYEKHRHPSLELMNYFVPTQATPILKDLRVTKNEHFLTSYLDIKLLNTDKVGIIFIDLSRTFTTPTNMFSTRYFTYFTPDTGKFSYQLPNNHIDPPTARVTPVTALNGFACWKYAAQANGSFLLGGHADLDSGLFTGPIVTTVSSKNTAANEERISEKIVQSPKINTVQTKRKKKKMYLPMSRKNRFGSSIVQHY